MKKIIITLAAMAIAVSSFAQASIGAGYLNQSKSNSDAKPLSGFYAGIDYNINIAGALGVAPGVYYNFATWSDGGKNANANVKEHYISIPVMFNYSINVADGFDLFAFAGPTGRFGLASETTGSVVGFSATGDNYKNDNYQRTALLIGGGVGADIADKVRFTVGYDYGLTNRYKNSNVAYNDKLFHVGVAFLF